MNWIQVLLIAAIVSLLFYLLRSRTSAKTKAWVKVGLIGYVLIVAFLFTTMSTYMRFKDLELKYARLARAVALQNAARPDATDPG